VRWQPALVFQGYQSRAAALEHTASTHANCPLPTRHRREHLRRPSRQCSLRRLCVQWQVAPPTCTHPLTQMPLTGRPCFDPPRRRADTLPRRCAVLHRPRLHPLNTSQCAAHPPDTAGGVCTRHIVVEGARTDAPHGGVEAGGRRRQAPGEEERRRDLVVVVRQRRVRRRRSDATPPAWPLHVSTAAKHYCQGCVGSSLWCQRRFRIGYIGLCGSKPAAHQLPFSPAHRAVRSCRGSGWTLAAASRPSHIREGD
jgi:hypothetical protein